MSINFSGYNENVVTFAISDSNVTMGTPVKMLSSGTVAKCESDEQMIGVAVNVRNGYAAVQLTGYIEMPTDDNFTVGYNKITATDGVKVSKNDLGREYLVVTYTDGVVGFIL